MKQLFSLLFLASCFVSCLACKSDSDCARLYSCTAGTCTHDSLFPITLIEVVGALLIFVLIACGISAGIGGGLLMLPVLLTLFNFTPHDGIPIIQASAMMSSFVAYLQRCYVRRSNSNKPIIDYEISMFCLPISTLGNAYGVKLNQMFPLWLLIVMIVLLLGYTLVTTTKQYVLSRGIRLYKAENLLKVHGEMPLLTEESEDAPRYSVFPLGTVRIIQVCAIALEFLSFILYILLVGGKANPSIIGIVNCSVYFWLLFAGYHVFVVALTFWIGRTILRRTAYDLTLGISPAPGSLQWSYRRMWFLALFSFAAGMGGTMLLVGCGLILGPLLLSYKLDAQITSATTLFLVLLSASTGTLQYWIAGVMDVEFAGSFCVVAGVASLTGVIVVKWAVNKYRRTSFIVFVLAGVVAASIVVIPIYDGFEVYGNIQDESFRAGFNSFCSSSA